MVIRYRVQKQKNRAVFPTIPTSAFALVSEIGYLISQSCSHILQLMWEKFTSLVYARCGNRTRAATVTGWHPNR